MNHRSLVLGLAMAITGGVGSLQAQADSTRVAELERRIEILAEELERLRSGEEAITITSEDARRLGLSPSAAAAYGRPSGASFAGYGEMLYENYADDDESGAPTDRTSVFDYLRATFYAGYRFNERFLFNSEIEVEHANEIFVEFAYLDWRASDQFGVRAGLLLIPVGLVNEFHEPTVFVGAERPVTERSIIPSTWRANGGGVYGSSGRFSYRAYVVNGLNGAGFSSSGLRGGRQKGIKAKSSDMALTARVDFAPMPGFFVGVSGYTGGADHGEIELDGSAVNARVTILSAHAQARFRGFDLRGLYARATVGEAARLNRALELGGDGGVAEMLGGGYLQAGYNLLSQTVSEAALTPYLRYEIVDTQARMPSGYERKGSTNSRYVTAGLDFKPVPGIVLKADQAWVTNDAGTGVGQFSVNVGFAF